MLVVSEWFSEKKNKFTYENVNSIHEKKNDNCAVYIIK